MATPLGTRIKDLRGEIGLSQTDLATKYGKSVSAVKMWELGYSEPSIEILIDMADSFQVTLEYLVGRSNDRQNAIPVVIDMSIPAGYRGKFDEYCKTMTEIFSKVKPSRLREYCRALDIIFSKNGGLLSLTVQGDESQSDGSKYYQIRNDKISKARNDIINPLDECIQLIITNNLIPLLTMGIKEKATKNRIIDPK